MEPEGDRAVATLHFMCGKIASGKTTLARRIAEQSNGILICEDVWLGRMYPGEHFTLQDYIRRSARLRAALAPHVETLLRRGMAVVFDFAGNTPHDRQWVRSIFERASAPHLLHVLNVADDVCKTRLRSRNADRSEGSQHTSDAEFDAISQYFVPPSHEEGFRMQIY